MNEPREESKIQYVVRDKPTERGLTINNILLAIVILGGGIFSTIVTSYMSHLTTSVSKMEDSLSAMRTTDGVTANELGHINAALRNCKEIHITIDKRIYKLETIVYREHAGDLNR